MKGSRSSCCRLDAGELLEKLLPRDLQFEVECESRAGFVLGSLKRCLCAVLCRVVGLLLKRPDAVKCKVARKSLKGNARFRGGILVCMALPSLLGQVLVPGQNSSRGLEGSPIWLVRAAGSQQTPVTSLGPELLSEHRNSHRCSPHPMSL